MENAESIPFCAVFGLHRNSTCRGASWENVTEDASLPHRKMLP
jgi:hypothetical protein